ncbi:MAG: long-chain-fatty-acid--CoA ligase [Pseudomonadota bacterium]
MNTIAEVLGESARKYGDKTALIFKSMPFSYLEMDLLSNKLANSLRDMGVQKGDRVSLYSQNSWEWLISYYAAAKIGAIVNPVNVMLTAEELLFVLDDCGAKVILTSPEKMETVLGISKEAKTLKHVVVYGDETASPAVSFNRLLEKGADRLTIARSEPDDVSTIGYTSGTTGHPKGAMLTHRGVMINSRLTANMHMKDQDEVVISALPTAHVYGNVVMNGTFITGGTLVLMERFNEEEFFDAIMTHKATMIEGVPSMYMMLLSHPGIDRCNMESLRKCSVGGQTISVKVMADVEERFGCPLFELWGMTEISGLGTTHPFLGENRHGSIGIALPYCETRIVDAENLKTVLGPDQPGELMIKGPIVMKGYYGNEKGTKETIEPDGWLHTGDIARMDGDGYVYVVDRLKDMILTAGYNVYPAEIERVLMLHPSAAMAAVGAIADEVKGELAKAYIVLRNGATCTEEEIIAFCRQHLAAYKVPRQVAFVGDLPKTSTGKIMRRMLHSLDTAK